MAAASARLHRSWRAVCEPQVIRASEMAGGVAHEINNPLAILKLRAEILGDLAEDAPPEFADLRLQITSCSEGLGAGSGKQLCPRCRAAVALRKRSSVGNATS